MIFSQNDFSIVFEEIYSWNGFYKNKLSFIAHSSISTWQIEWNSFVRYVCCFAFESIQPPHQGYLHNECLLNSMKFVSKAKEKAKRDWVDRETEKKKSYGGLSRLAASQCNFYGIVKKLCLQRVVRKERMFSMFNTFEECNNIYPTMMWLWWHFNTLTLFSILTKKKKNICSQWTTKLLFIFQLINFMHPIFASYVWPQNWIFSKLL